MTVIQMGERELTRLRVLIDLGVTTRKCILKSAPGSWVASASDRIDAVLATMTPGEDLPCSRYRWGTAQQDRQHRRPGEAPARRERT